MHSEKYLKELQRLHSRKGFGVAKNIPQGVQKLIEMSDLFGKQLGQFTP